MLIYTGGVSGERKVAACAERSLGTMITTGPKTKTNKVWSEFPCALDNGAFRCWQRGYPWMEKAFWSQLESCHKNGIDLDFIVAPDIVAGGRRSLEFSDSWIRGALMTAPRLALVVQDGMSVSDVLHSDVLADNVTHIFVGGTVTWKWETAEEWVEFAHERGLKCHIGRCGKIEALREAERIGADSVDSTSFARNDSWHIIDEFIQPTQEGLGL